MPIVLPWMLRMWDALPRGRDVRNFAGGLGVGLVALTGAASAGGKAKPEDASRVAVTKSFKGISPDTANILRQMGCRSEAQLQRDIIMTAENLFMEARGGGLQGMADVAQVLRNRANFHTQGRGVCLADQVEAKFQFEWLNKHIKDGRVDPAYVPGSEAAAVIKRVPAEAKAWADALALAKISVAADHAYERRVVNFEGVIAAHVDALQNAVDVVGKADHYYATWMDEKGVTPSWGKPTGGMKQIVIRHGHRFLDSGRCKVAAPVPEIQLPGVEKAMTKVKSYNGDERLGLDALVDAVSIMGADR